MDEAARAGAGIAATGSSFTVKPGGYRKAADVKSNTRRQS
jgi:hypothetical protein